MKNSQLFIASFRTALFALFVVLSLPLLHAASGQPPELMTYQGYLVDGNGVELGLDAPKNYDVIFSIYDSQSGGNLKWAEQQTVTVDKGFFSVLLGEGSQVGGNPRNSLSDLFNGADASDRFIGITVKRIGQDNTDVDILPRMRLLTSPFSFLAQNAVNAANLPNGGGVSGINTLEFGQGIEGKEPNAGKIGYKTFSDGLDIVGAGEPVVVEGVTTTNRRIKLWTEGGLTVTGPGVFGGSVQADGGILARGGPPGGNGANNNGYAFSGNGGDNDSGMFSSSDGHVEFYINGAPKGIIDVNGFIMNNIFIGDAGHGYEWAGFTYREQWGANHYAMLQHVTGKYTLINAVNGDDSVIGFSFDNVRKMALYPNGNLNISGNLNIPGGLVGIGTSTPQNRLHVLSPLNYQPLRLQNSAGYYDVGPDFNGHFAFSASNGAASYISRTDGNYYVGSDLRLKKDVLSETGVLERVLKLRPVSFRYNHAPDDSKKTLGFIAQELEPLFPEAVNEADSLKSVSYSSLVPVAVGAIQELHAEIQQKDDDIESLRREVKELRALVETMLNR